MGNGNGMNETVIGGRIPSVQTRWRGSGTMSALTQALVIAFTIGLLISLAYAGVRTQITFWEWHQVFTWIGLVPCVYVTLRFWRNPSEETPEWWSRAERAWLYGPTIWISNLWPFIVYLWWGRLVNVLADKFANAPEVAIGAAFLIGGLVGGGLLIYRLTTELIQPLEGNAIEPMIKKMEINFERWKLERDRSVDVIRAERDQLRQQVSELRVQLKDNQMRVRIMYANRGSDTNPALLDQEPEQ